MRPKAANGGQNGHQGNHNGGGAGAGRGDGVGRAAQIRARFEPQPDRVLLQPSRLLDHLRNVLGLRRRADARRGQPGELVRGGALSGHIHADGMGEALRAFHGPRLLQRGRERHGFVQIDGGGDARRRRRDGDRRSDRQRRDAGDRARCGAQQARPQSAQRGAVGRVRRDRDAEEIGFRPRALCACRGRRNRGADLD